MRCKIQNSFLISLTLLGVFSFFILISCSAGQPGSANISNINSLSSLDGPPHADGGPVNQEAPGSVETPVSPQSDWTNIVAKLACDFWSQSEVPHVQGGPQPEDPKILNHVSGKLYLSPGNLPCCNGLIVRVVDWDSQQYVDMRAADLNGEPGHFAVTMKTSLFPKWTFFLADKDYDPATVGVQSNCPDAQCLPPSKKVRELEAPSCHAPDEQPILQLQEVGTVPVMQLIKGP